MTRGISALVHSTVTTRSGACPDGWGTNTAYRLNRLMVRHSVAAGFGRAGLTPVLTANKTL
jgi:hypothetical protein